MGAAIVICIDGGVTVSAASSARDIVVHVLGVELDPEVFTVGDVLSCNG